MPNSWTDRTKFGTRMQIHRGIDIAGETIIPSTPQGAFQGVRGVIQIQKCGKDAKQFACLHWATLRGSGRGVTIRCGM